MSIHMKYIQSQIFQSLYFCSKTENFTSPLQVDPFFAIIWAVIDEIKNFLREMFRINGDIYDAKYEKH